MESQKCLASNAIRGWYIGDDCIGDDCTRQCLRQFDFLRIDRNEKNKLTTQGCTRFEKGCCH
jgi:hypothetical protein